jgi:hypothetical protein
VRQALLAPRPSTKPAAVAFAGTLPKAPKQANVHAIISDIYDIAQREVAAFKGRAGLKLEELRGLAELARTLKEVRALEKLVEDELGDELGKASDEELEARAHGAVIRKP